MYHILRCCVLMEDGRRKSFVTIQIFTKLPMFMFIHMDLFLDKLNRPSILSGPSSCCNWILVEHSAEGIWFFMSSIQQVASTGMFLGLSSSYLRGELLKWYLCFFVVWLAPKLGTWQLFSIISSYGLRHNFLLGLIIFYMTRKLNMSSTRN